ncbi:chemotaxis protein CheW [Vreelandella aquamarina]|uniref:chemotaxis protein CheA n=1 Tax=Vreelandella aquamarina TaxID=77097 RepID=UPI00384AA56E
MSPLLQSFIHEARDNLEVASRCLLALEQAPDDSSLLDELFRAMHTIKGASGLFEDLSEFSRLLHVIEDGLDQVRSHTLPLTPALTDIIFDALDVITQWLDSVEATQALPETAPTQLSEQLAILAQAFQGETVQSETAQGESASSEQTALEATEGTSPALQASSNQSGAPAWVLALPDATRRQLVKAAQESDSEALVVVTFTPPEECFFQGHDPLQSVKMVPGLQALHLSPREPWPALEELDPFRCQLDFSFVALTTEDAVLHHLRYLSESVSVAPLAVEALIQPAGEVGSNDLDNELFTPFVEEAARLAEAYDWPSLQQRLAPLQELCGDTLYQHSVVHWLALALRCEPPSRLVVLALIDALTTGEYAPHKVAAKPVPANTRASTGDSLVASSTAAVAAGEGDTPHGDVEEGEEALAYQVLVQQAEVLATPVKPELFASRLVAVANVVQRMLSHLGDAQAQHSTLQEALTAAQAQQDSQPLKEWLKAWLDNYVAKRDAATHDAAFTPTPAPVNAQAPLSPAVPEQAKVDSQHNPQPHDHSAEKAAKADKPGATSQTIRVEQQRIDELMTLAGELVVAKNALPFLAKHATEGMSPGEIAKELNSHYANIDRIADRLQQAVMGARMVPLSVVFQRFPRLVRDMTRKLDKHAELVLEGEETEADKHVVDHLADPLIHLVRNSLDHALESPAERLAAGKPEKGMIKLRAQALDDQVLIEVMDDGRGIDVDKLKQKAYQRGLLDEQKLETITHQEALQLIFAAGLSTAEKVSDISGRGVGMDAVRTAVAASGGQISVASEPGEGTTIRILLPLSMAVARVMMVRIGEQDYGIAMANIRETVRVPTTAIHRIKHSESIVLRDKLIPLKRTRTLLGLENAPPRDEEAILIVELDGQQVGLVIDDFRQGIDIVQKPMEGIMAGYQLYSGSALMGDGRVLLVINLPALINRSEPAAISGERYADRV